MTIRICAVLIVVLVSRGVAAADSTTHHANLGEAPSGSCQKITLSVQQSITPGGTTTNLYYKLVDCQQGTVAEGNAAIPASAYSVQNKQTHILRLQTPAGSAGLQGLIDLTFRATTTQQTTFSGTWTERQGNSMTRTSEEQFFSSAQVSGSVIGWNASAYPGAIGSQTQVGK